MMAILRSECLTQATVEGCGSLDVRGLTIGFPNKRGLSLAANGVRFSVPPSKTLGLVGESGCGKSVTLRSIIGMVPPPGEVLGGEIIWEGRDLTKLSQAAIRELRGHEISMIFQDPSASLNPVYSIGTQISEVCQLRLGMNRKAARERVIELLSSVGFSAPEERARAFPHQLSGGLRQRAMIAMAIACNPKLLLADEPSTALDVSIQDQILTLLLQIQHDSGMAMILVSHDLGVIAETCDQIAVMYAGFLVEQGSRDEVIESARHPYTRALLASELTFAPGRRRERLDAIGGQAPDLADLPTGCPFQPRCRYAQDACSRVSMRLDGEPGAHVSACPIDTGA
jgi:peptide/nickel transport system ATP-binding protein